MSNPTSEVLVVPKPGFVPKGATKTSARDYSGFPRCIACGRSTTRADCRGKDHHVDPSGECCVGMLVISATWEPRSFESDALLDGDGMASSEWAVCPTCAQETTIRHHAAEEAT